MLGLGAGLGSMHVQRRLLRWEIPVLGVAMAFVLLFAANEVIGRVEGVVLLGMLVVFVAGSGAVSAESLRSREARVDPEVRADRASNLRELW